MISLRRLRQWFALPDAVRSPWKRRLVCGASLMVVLAGITTWRGCVPPLGEDVTLRDVSREEAAVIVEEIRKERSARAVQGVLLLVASGTGHECGSGLLE